MARPYGGDTPNGRVEGGLREGVREEDAWTGLCLVRVSPLHDRIRMIHSEASEFRSRKAELRLLHFSLGKSKL